MGEGEPSAEWRSIRIDDNGRTDSGTFQIEADTVNPEGNGTVFNHRIVMGDRRYVNRRRQIKTLNDPSCGIDLERGDIHGFRRFANQFLSALIVAACDEHLRQYIGVQYPDFVLIVRQTKIRVQRQGSGL